MKYNKLLTGITAFITATALMLLPSCKADNDTETTTDTATYEQTTEQETPLGIISVPYTSLDSLNPFYTKSTLNSALTSLLYRSLYVLDAGFEPTADMATDAQVNGTSVTVSLNADMRFSDDSYLSADDVVYSFNKAKSSYLYSQSLKNVSSCASSGKLTVTFTLASADVNVLSVLTFPIVRNGSAESADVIPTGSGRYYVQVGELRTNLLCNMNYNGDIAGIGTIRLVDVNDSSSVNHMLTTGEIDCYFSDLSDGSAERTYANVNEVYLNELVYIGINAGDFPLNNADMRKALSFACDRSEIADNAFQSHARTTEVPFNPSWTPITETKESIYSASLGGTTAANTLLKTLGYGTDGNSLTLRLLYMDTGTFIRNTATVISELLSKVNITVELVAAEEDEYISKLKSGDFDLYLGDVKLTANMDLSGFFDEDGAFSYGIPAELSVRTKYAQYKAGTESLDAFLRSFNESEPFIPLLFRNGRFCYSRNITGTIEVTAGNLYGTIDKWKCN